MGALSYLFPWTGILAWSDKPVLEFIAADDVTGL